MAYGPDSSYSQSDLQSERARSKRDREERMKLGDLLRHLDNPEVQDKIVGIIRDRESDPDSTQIHMMRNS